jgi:uncharacterized protein YkwD
VGFIFFEANVWILFITSSIDTIFLPISLTNIKSGGVSVRRMLFVLIIMAAIGIFALVTHRNTTTVSQTSTCFDIPANPDYLASKSEQDAIAAINNARAQEHLHTLRLPSNYYQLDPIQRQFILINLERVDRGLKALGMDANLAQIARGYSQQLRDLQFFSHTSPIAGTFKERINSNKAAADHYTEAAENLAGNPVMGAGAIYEYMYDDSVEACGHRDTILDPGLTLVGIGWVPGSAYGSVSAQEFLSPAPWNPYMGANPSSIAPQIRIEEIQPSISIDQQLQQMHRFPKVIEQSKVSYRVVIQNNVTVARVTWFVDRFGNSPHTGMVLTLDLNRLSPGTHILLAYAVNGEQYYGVARYEIVV